MRCLLPNVEGVTAPSSQFITAAEANVAANQPTESTVYNEYLGSYKNAPGYRTAVANPPNCFGPSGNPGFDCSLVPTTPGAFGDSCYSLALTGFTPGTPCSVTYTATPKALAWEYIFSVRVDQKLGNNDNLFGRYKLDHGLQPTFLDPISPKFDANSLQPAWDFQLSQTHLLGQTKTNTIT